MSDGAARLVRMANDIARNLATLGEEEAAVATAEHIALFWDPRMRAQALALLGQDEAGFSPAARAALKRLSGLQQAQKKAPQGGL